jgi:hypothetical protein
VRSIFAGLLLLFQLQPMLGAAACLALVQWPAEECTMPDHGNVPAENASAPAPIPSSGCPLAAICAPAAPAIPVGVELLVTTIPPRVAVAISGSRAPADISFAPPLPPPRA